MNHHFKAHQIIRDNLRELLKTTEHEELLTIPAGFNNNIYWNIAHCLATQQLLHYYLSGNPFRIDKLWIEKYKKGTLPNFDATASDVDDLSFLLKETSRIFVKDFDEEFFTEYTPYTTTLGMDLRSIQDAIVYNNIHESLHLGYAMAQKRALLGEDENW
ncbi:MAG: DinB family protein [Chryseobacterium sp.]|nr:MAG: DinB family protein [Chryseobacterium sp.]